MTRILRDFDALTPASNSGEDVRAIRGEVETSMTEVRIKLTQLVNTIMERMQAEAERRADAMLQKLTQTLKFAPKNNIERTAYISESGATLGRSTRSPGSQGQNQPTRAAQPSWAAVTGAVPQRMTNWTTITNSRKKARKHSLDQRRNLFTLCAADGVCYTVTPQKYDRYISTLWSATIGVRAVR
jgi:hypothetical protein